MKKSYSAFVMYRCQHPSTRTHQRNPTCYPHLSHVTLLLLPLLLQEDHVGPSHLSFHCSKSFVTKFTSPSNGPEDPPNLCLFSRFEPTGKKVTGNNQREKNIYKKKNPARTISPGCCGPHNTGRGIENHKARSRAKHVTP